MTSCPNDVTVATLTAIEGSYRSRYHQFLRVAEALCQDAELARDAVQEAFASAIRSRFSFRGESRLDTWLWAAVVNSARSQREASRIDRDAETVVVASADPPSPTDHALIASLPERQKLVLFLRYYADLDYRSIATVLEISPGTVGATLNQAHAALRRSVQEVP
jgi:RNA polymerase sigma factor (sigma-70 family)